MSRRDDLEMVVRLACMTEDRTDAEQRALVRVAAKLDREVNRVTPGNPTWNGDWWQARPLSVLAQEADETRVLDEGHHPVPVPPSWKPPSWYLAQAAEAAALRPFKRRRCTRMPETEREEDDCVRCDPFNVLLDTDPLALRDIAREVDWLRRSSKGVVGLRNDGGIMPWDEVLKLYMPSFRKAVQGA